MFSEINAILLPIVIGLVEVAKRLGIANRYLPVVAIILGILLTWLLGGTFSAIILGGLVVGLGSVGLYETAKTTMLGR